MPVDAKALEERLVVERVTVSCSLSGSRRGDTITMAVRSVGGEFTLDEAHIVHKIVSKHAMEMAYMDALAQGTMGKAKVAEQLPKRKRNYDALIAGLERKMNKKLEAEISRTKKSA